MNLLGLLVEQAWQDIHIKLHFNAVWLFALILLQGCSVFAVADAAVSTTATVVSTGVKAAGAVADAVIPDSKPKK